MLAFVPSPALVRAVLQVLMTGLSRFKTIALCGLSALAIVRPAAAQGSADVVLEWNRILIAALNVPGASPATVFVTRPAAIMQVAVFDALNSIDFQYQPYAIRATMAPGASRDVAAAAAAGSAVGSTAASAILAARANDGWDHVAEPYIMPNLPGN